MPSKATHQVYPIPKGKRPSTDEEQPQVSTTEQSNKNRDSSSPPRSWSNKRFSTCSERSLSRAERNVVNFIQTSQIPPAVIRSNSYTMQDVDKQRRSIQASMEGMTSFDVCDDDPNYKYFHSLSTLKGRRVSKSLPELNHLRHFPLMTTRYHSEIEESEDDDDESNSTRDIPEKTAWKHKSDFVFTGIVWALGLNNLWRFPYYCFKFPAGSFLFAFAVTTVLVGLPLLSMEYALGQLTRRGPIAAFGGLCPLLKGVPVAASVLCLTSAPLLSTINSWSLFYFFKAFHSSPLWSKCGNPWNTKHCSKNATTFFPPSPSFESNASSPYIEKDPDYADEDFDTLRNETLFNPGNVTTQFSPHSVNVTTESKENSPFNSPLTFFNVNSTPTQEFFDLKVLELDLESSTWGSLQWELILFVFLTWLVVFIALRRTILFSSKKNSCFCLVPYVILLVLFTRALTFEGAKNGLLYFIQPSWKDLLNSDLWLYACSLSIQSLGCVIGVSFAQATCNRERNNFLWDAFVIAFVNIATVIFVGLILFSTLGHLSHKRQIDVSLVVISDPGLAFVAFSELLSSIPFAPWWAVVFFFTLFCLGVDHQISLIRSFLVAIEDAYGAHIKRNFLAHQVFALLICFFSFLISLAFLSQQGILLIQAFDQYLTTVLILILAFFEIILMGWFYGGSNLAQVIKLKISKALGFFFPFSWTVLTPCSLLGILSWSAIAYQEPLFRNEHRFPPLMHSVIVGIAVLLLLLIPLVGYRQVLRTPKGSFLSRVINACKPFERETPSVPLVEPEEGQDTTIHNHQRHQVQRHESQPNDTYRRPSILDKDWTDNVQSNGRAASNTVTTKGETNNRHFHIPVTLSLIQGLDRETDL